jgi:hypothetical protein
MEGYAYIHEETNEDNQLWLLTTQGTQSAVRRVETVSDVVLY